MKLKQEALLLSLALTLLLFVTATAALFALCKSIGVPTPWIGLTPVLSLVAAILAGRLGLTRQSTVVLTALVLASLAGSLALSNLFFDFSPDGTGYHQDAILQLRFTLLSSSLNNLYVNGYPKLAWLYSAALYSTTGSLHIGKSINIIVALAVWLVAWSVLPQLRPAARVIASTAFMLNPITASQLFTHYVDGALGGFLTVAILGMFGLVVRQQPGSLLGGLCILGIIGSASLKHTGFVFALIMAGAYFYLRWRGVGTRERMIDGRIVASLWFIGVLLLANPYLTNLRAGRHIFFPSMGAQRVGTLISRQTTEEFYRMNPISKLLMSAFGKTSNHDPRFSPPVPEIKLPFTVDQSELDALGGVDIRWGGWGPLFGGILLVSLLCLVTLVRGGQLPKHVNVVLLCLGMLTLVNPESWWARFNPQLYVLAVLILVCVYSWKPSQRWLAGALLLVACLNTGLVGRASVRHVTAGNGHINNMLDELSSGGGGYVCWSRKTTHLEPILERRGLEWRHETECGRGSTCREILGETVCAGVAVK